MYICMHIYVVGGVTCCGDVCCDSRAALYYVVYVSEKVHLVSGYRRCTWQMIVRCLHPHHMFSVATVAKDHPSYLLVLVSHVMS